MFSAYIRLYFRLMLMRIEPQDIPHSKALLWSTFFMLLLTGYLFGSFVYSPVENLIVNVFDAGLLSGYLYLVLRFNGYQKRFQQTVTSAYGIYVVIYLLLLPAAILIGDSQQMPVSTLVMLAAAFEWFLLLYSVLVLAYIIKFSISTNMATGVAFSLTYYVISMIALKLLFPVPV